jgi:hypothetical protein
VHVHAHVHVHVHAHVHVHVHVHVHARVHVACAVVIWLQVTPQLVIGMTLVANSTFQYHKVPYMPAAPVPSEGIAPAPADKPLLEAKGDISDASDGVCAISELEIGRLARRPLQPEMD